MTNVHPESHVAAYGGFVLEGGGVGEVIRAIVSTPSGGGESFRGYPIVALIQTIFTFPYGSSSSSVYFP